MRTKLLNRIGVALALLWIAGSAIAQSLPAYYPSEGFQRTGRVDAVLADTRKIIINDIPYVLSDNAVVHALNSYSVPLSRLRSGNTIGFRTSGQRQVTTIWILPDNYARRGRR